MIEDMSNKTFARLLVLVVTLPVGVGIVWASWAALGAIAHYVGLALVFLVALALVFLVVRATQEIARHHEDIAARHHTRSLEQQRTDHTAALEQQKIELEHARLMHELTHKSHMDTQRFSLEQHLAITRVKASEHGYDALVGNGTQGYNITAIPYQGRYAVSSSTERTTDPRQLAAPAAADTDDDDAIDHAMPTQDFILSRLKRNALEIAPGIDAKTGELRFLSIEDAVHFKLIGSSGFGKSCLAASILDQAIKLNGPDVLQVALLDLEHKTSVLFEDAPHLVEYKAAGGRRVPLASTNADEVATHLGHLKSILDQRAKLNEYDLQQQPVILIYVEEMLSLQYEVDPKLLSQMLADLSVLALRARKYRMFLLACAQTDYSTPELKNAQKQFRSRIAFAVDTTSARAAGFMSTELIKQNFLTAEKGDGHFVLEYPGYAGICIAPSFDVRAMLLARSTPVHQAYTAPERMIVNADSTPASLAQNTTTDAPERTPQAGIGDIQEVLRLHSLNWGKQAIIEKVYAIKKGGSLKYKEASKRYDLIMALYAPAAAPLETVVVEEEEG